MRFKYRLFIAEEGLLANKTRSLLTVLGIVIGVTAIILIVSIGRGAEELIVSQIQGLGSRTIVVIPGRQPSGPADAAQVFSDSLKERDLELLRNKANVPTLSEVMPVLFGGETTYYQGETFRANIFGATELLSRIFDLRIEEGGFISGEDVRARADVVVIGSRVRDELFGAQDAIGERIKIKGRNFRVIGVLSEKGQSSFFNFDETAIIPYTTAQHYIFGIRYFHRFIIQAEEEDQIPRTVRDIEITLRESHGITNPDKDDFFVETPSDIASRLGIVGDVLTLFLVSIAAISLIVGGIGIMNIMLVSVAERNKEIGLRKAIGATEKDILLQFLLEAVILTTIGGIAGVALGLVLSLLITFILSNFLGFTWQFIFPFSAALIGLLVAAGAGLIFGIYPAKKAAEKNPIETLRHE